MNILQIEDQIKGLPDNRLIEEAKAPSGQMPQYLLISEVQRRSDMRKRYEAEQPQNEGTITDQIMHGGIGSIQRPPQGPGAPPQMPQQMPQGPQMPQQPPQGAQGMAEGGITNIQRHRNIPGQTYIDEEAKREFLKKLEGENAEYTAGGIGGFLGDMGNAAKDAWTGVFGEWNGVFGDLNTVADEPAAPPVRDLYVAAEQRVQMPENLAANTEQPSIDEIDISQIDKDQKRESYDALGLGNKYDELAELSKQPRGGAETKGHGIERQSIASSRDTEYDRMLKQQREAAWSNALIQLGAGIAGNDLSGGLANAGKAMAQGQEQASQYSREKMRQDSYNSMNESAAAQRADQFDARMAQSKSQFAQNLTQRENEASGIADRAIAKALKAAADENRPMNRKEKSEATLKIFNEVMDGDEFAMKAKLEALGVESTLTGEALSTAVIAAARNRVEAMNGTGELRGKPGTQGNPIDATTLTGRPPSGTWVRKPDGSVVLVP